jgi:DNA topoisomerase IA
MGKTISIKFDQDKEGQKLAYKIMNVLRRNVPKTKERKKNGSQ